MIIIIRLPKPATCVYAGFFLGSIWAFASAAAELLT